MIKHWTAAQLATLQRLRAGFLQGTAGEAEYWQNPGELALYDATFGERIGWKWDAVLRELHRRGWTPQSTRALDWGCGSGVAGRRALQAWPSLRTLALHDRSALAIRYASQRARAEFPQAGVQSGDSMGPGTLLLVSHVLNELPPPAYRRLLAIADAAAEIIWVEAGTHADSRRLLAVREHLLSTGFQAIAPCTHQARCGMLSPENEAHWCHHFGAPPPPAFQDAAWAEFGRELGIDLRSLPYSFLVLARTGEAAPEGWSRIIGAPRDATGYSRVLSCQASGVTELILQKRDAPALLRQVRKEAEAPLYRWEVEGTKIRSGVAWPPDVGAQPDATSAE